MKKLSYRFSIILSLLQQYVPMSATPSSILIIFFWPKILISSSTEMSALGSCSSALSLLAARVSLLPVKTSIYGPLICSNTN